MPKNPKASALKKLRAAALRIDLILCLNEVEDEYIVGSLKKSLRSLRSALRVLDPNQRLPSVLLDTKLGRSIQEAKKSIP